jgi:hypothetical protein
MENKKNRKNPNNMFCFLLKLCLIGREWKWMRFRSIGSFLMKSKNKYKKTLGTIIKELHQEYVESHFFWHLIFFLQNVKIFFLLEKKKLIHISDK